MATRAGRTRDAIPERLVEVISEVTSEVTSEASGRMVRPDRKSGPIASSPRAYLCEKCSPSFSRVHLAEIL